MNTSGTSTCGDSRTPSTANLFKADPVRYAPQFANFCAVALARGEVREANPEYWLISDGKLYLFGKSIGPDLFRKDYQHLLERANGNRALLEPPSGAGRIEPRLREPLAQMREVARIAELVAKGCSVERWIGASHGLRRARRFLHASGLGMRHGQHHVIEPRIGIATQIELRLLHGIVVTAPEVIGQAQRETVEGIELGVDALREFQRLDCRVGMPSHTRMLPRPASASASLGLIAIARSICARASSNWL